MLKQQLIFLQAYCHFSGIFTVYGTYITQFYNNLVEQQLPVHCNHV